MSLINYATVSTSAQLSKDQLNYLSVNFKKHLNQNYTRSIYICTTFQNKPHDRTESIFYIYHINKILVLSGHCL